MFFFKKKQWIFVLYILIRDNFLKICWIVNCGLKWYHRNKGSDLAKTTEFLSYYALPYIKNIKDHLAFKEMFTKKWVDNRDGYVHCNCACTAKKINMLLSKICIRKKILFCWLKYKRETNMWWQRFSGFRAGQMMRVCLTDTAESFPLSAFTVLCLCFVRSVHL